MGDEVVPPLEPVDPTPGWVSPLSTTEPVPAHALALYELGAEPASPGPPPPRRSKRRRGVWIAGAAGLATVVVGVSFLVVPTVGSSNPPTSAGTTPSSPLSPTPVAAPPTSEVAALLERRSAAVAARDKSAFLADIDPQATQFLTRQTLMFNNMMKLPLTRTRWTVVTESVRGNSLEGYGGPTYLTAVEFTYQLKGFDHRPVARPMAFTFVLKEGRWLLAGDGDATNVLYSGPPEPWEVTPILVRRAGQALVIGEERDREVLSAFAKKADTALTRVRLMWKAPGQDTIVIYVPRQKQLHERYLDGVQGWAAAYEFVVYDRVPAWATARPRAAGTRVVLNTYQARPQDSMIPALLRHEATHVAAAPWTKAGAPTWLIEGAAEYTAYRDDPYGRLFPRSVFKASAAGHLMTKLPTNKEFYGMSTGYDRTFLLCTYIKRTYGEAKLLELYRTAGAISTSSKTAAGVKKDIPKVLGLSQTQLLINFNAWAKVNIRPA